MAHEVGTIVGANTPGEFTITRILTKDEVIEHWITNQGKSMPHDKAYEITLKCGKTYYTLHTQIYKCMQRGTGWLKCHKCDGCQKECAMDGPMSHTLSRVPNREDIVAAGEVYGNLRAVDFAFNAKRHNYWLFECVDCGAEFIKIPTNVKDFGDCVCPMCNEERYKGPKVIKDYLLTRGLNFEKEKRFSDCVYIGTLPFDFAVYNDNDSINCLIEFDGEQHYRYTPHWHGSEEGFELQQFRDAIKTKYCEKNNIKLIRIPYTEFGNITDILDREILI